MSKQYESGQTLQQKISRGIDILADNVAATMGPRGRNVILHQNGANPIITKDGVKHGMLVRIKKRFMVGKTCEVNLGDRIDIFVASNKFFVKTFCSGALETE